MAAAEYLPLLGATLPVILSPIVAWALGRSTLSRQSVTIDYLNKRLDFLERLNKLHTQLPEGPLRQLLDTEIEYCRAFLAQAPMFITRGAEQEAAAPPSHWARFFLTQPAVSVRKRIFKGLFYFFFGFAMLSLLIAPTVLSSAPSAEVGTILYVFVFYFVIALLFRHAAR